MNREYYLTNTSIDEEMEVTFKSSEENKTFNKKKVENFIKFHSKQLNKA